MVLEVSAEGAGALAKAQSPVTAITATKTVIKRTSVTGGKETCKGVLVEDIWHSWVTRRQR